MAIYVSQTPSPLRTSSSPPPRQKGDGTWYPNSAARYDTNYSTDNVFAIIG